VETFWIVGLQINALRSHPTLNHEISVRLFGSFDLLFVQDGCHLQISDFVRLGTIPHITASNEYTCYKWTRRHAGNWQNTFDIGNLDAPLVAFSFLKINPLHTQQSGVRPELDFAAYLLGAGSKATVQMLNTLGWAEAILAVTDNNLEGLFEKVADWLSQLRYGAKGRPEHFAEKTLTIIGHNLDVCASGPRRKIVPLSRREHKAKFLTVDCSLACKPNAMAKVKEAAQKLLGPQANLGLRFGPTDLHFQVSLKGITTINALREKLDEFKQATAAHLVRTHTSFEYVDWQSSKGGRGVPRWPVLVKISPQEARDLASLGPDGELVATAIYRFGNLTQNDLSADAYGDLLNSVIALKQAVLKLSLSGHVNWSRHIAGWLAHLEAAINQRSQNVYLGLEESPFVTYPARVGMQRVFKALEAYAKLVLRRFAKEWTGFACLGSLPFRFEHFADMLIIPPDALLQSTSHWALTHELMHILENITPDILSLSRIKQYTPRVGFKERKIELASDERLNLLESMTDVLDFAFCCPLSLREYLSIVWEHLTRRIIEEMQIEAFASYLYRSFAVVCYEHFGKKRLYDDLMNHEETAKLLWRYIPTIENAAGGDRFHWSDPAKRAQLDWVIYYFVSDPLAFMPWIYDRVHDIKPRMTSNRLSKRKWAAVATKLEQGVLLDREELARPEVIAWHLRAAHSPPREASNRVTITWLLSLWHLYKTGRLGPDLSKWVPPAGGSSAAT
jgi:hypothetical protein